MPHNGSILFVDAYDSFSENIVALLRDLLGVFVEVITVDDQLSTDTPAKRQRFFKNFDAIVLGPGPGDPRCPSDAGLFSSIWTDAQALEIPVLGICLGFQSLCSHFGLDIVRMSLPCHGHAKRILHKNQDIFENSREVLATCYNSLAVLADGLVETSRDSGYSSPTSFNRLTPHTPKDLSNAVTVGLSGQDGRSVLQPLAWDNEGYLMSVHHKDYPFYGFQFHPESCKSNSACHQLILNWWLRIEPWRGNANHEHKDKVCAAPPTSEDSYHTQTKISIQNFLTSLTERNSREVSFDTMPLTMNARLVADLCNSMSVQGSRIMLESTKAGRFSMFAFPDQSTWSLEFGSGRLAVLQAGNSLQTWPMQTVNVLEVIESFMLQMRCTGGSPDVPFWGGLVGYFSYEFGLDQMDISTHDESSKRLVPDTAVMWVDRSVVIDHEAGLVYVQTLRNNDQAWVTSMISTLSSLTNSTEPSCATALPPVSTNLPFREPYIDSICDCFSRLHAGNSYELCLTTSSTVQHASQPYALYTSLQHRNPARFASYLSVNETTILSSSPELFLTIIRPKPTSPSINITMAPMKGTLSKRLAPDISTARALLATPKEEAENLMIVDLIRHDLHRTIGPHGTVTVSSLFEIVETETLYQLVSRITASLPIPSTISLPRRQTQAVKSHIRALRHTLPPGSMTGAPKKRSCEILRGIEKRNRGVYSGVIGYFDVGGGGAWSVAIRCAFSHASEDQTVDLKGDGRREEKVRTWHVGAGGAVTVLSEPEGEWREMKGKMEGVLRGLGVQESEWEG